MAFFRNLSIGKKLVGMCLILVALPISLLTYLSVNCSSKALKEGNMSFLDQGTLEIRETMDNLFIRIQEDLGKFSNSGNLQTYLSLQEGSNKGANTFMHQNAATVLEGLMAFPRIQVEQKEAKLGSDIQVAGNLLNRLGGIHFSTSETQFWKIENQYTHDKSERYLPLPFIGEQPLRPIRDFFFTAPLVDEMTEMTGSSCTVFQRMNPEGDMLRIASTVRKTDGKRAVGTYIPAVNPDGKPNSVIKTVLAGNSYEGRAFVVDDWYITVYRPLKDETGEVFGILYVGIREKDIASLQKIITSTRVGSRGFPFVVDGEGTIVLHPDRSLEGKKLGRDLDLYGLETLCKKGQTDETVFTTYSVNGENKGAALRYFPSWDWTFITSYYPQDMASVMVDMTREKLLLDIEELGHSAIKTKSGKQPLYSQVRFLNTAGLEIFKLQEGKACSPGEMANQSLSDWFQKGIALSAGEIWNSDVEIAVNTGLPEMRLVSPVYIGKKLEGLVALNLNWEAITELVRDKTYGKTGYATVLNENGEAVCHPKITLADHFFFTDPQLGRLAKLVTDHIIKGEVGNTTYPFHGDEKAVSYRPMPLGNQTFFIAASVPTSEIFSAVSDLTRTILLIGSALILGGALIGWFFSRSLTKPIRRMMAITEKAGAGDLSMSDEELASDRGDELGVMASSLATMMGSQKETLGMISRESGDNLARSEALAAMAEQSSRSLEAVGRTVEELATISESNAAALEEVSVSIQEIAGSAQLSAKAASDGAIASRETTHLTRESSVKVLSMIEDFRQVGEQTTTGSRKISDLADSVREIHSFVDIITKISDQTNLLALNAAIEAARAGNAGRGFAVVADEVRKLAEESARAAGEIGDLMAKVHSRADDSLKITSSTERVTRETVQKAEAVQKELEGSIRKVEEINQIMQDMASSAEEQAASSEEMAAAVDQTSQGTSQGFEALKSIRANAVESTEAARAVAKESEGLMESAKRLQKELMGFKLHA